MEGSWSSEISYQVDYKEGFAQKEAVFISKLEEISPRAMVFN
jgi:hypothetical protein